MNEQENTSRERLGSRLGFILISAGCAIGLGNVWRFPYIAGQNGGGWFVAIYLACLALIGVPVLLMEFAVGRGAQKSLAKAHGVLTPDKPLWKVHGAAGLLGLTLLMMFYTTVTGWMIIYFVKSACGSFAGLNPAAIGADFSAMLGSPGVQAVAMLGVTIGSAAVCAFGLQKSVEPITKVMMACLLVLLIVLAVHSLYLEGAEKGLSFYLVPDFARMKSVGIAKVVVEAMNHAFFTLSLGIGSMTIFGSYIVRTHTLAKEGLHIAALDTFVAITSGLVIIPACFAFGVDQAQGPGLVFVTLPNVFNHMVGGRFWGSLFFLFMSCAALTTVIAVFEGILANVREYLGWSRLQASVALAVSISILSLPCLLGFNVLSGFQPLGAGTCVLDLEDFLVSNLLLPLGGLTFAIYCCHKCGWGWENFVAEVNAGKGLKIGGSALRIYCQWGIPCLFCVIFILGLLEKFKVISL